MRWPSVPSNAFAALVSRGRAVIVLPDQEWMVVRLGWEMSHLSMDKYQKGNAAAQLLKRVAFGH